MKILCFIPLLLICGCATAQTDRTPCPRNQPVIAYHQKEKVIYLFGGYCSRDKKRLNDLWKFDGKSWVAVEVEIAPSPRSGHSMIYDPFKDRLFVFGGKSDGGDLLDDVWVWDGQKWGELSGKGPEPRQSHRMAFNSVDGTALLFGGSDIDGNALSDTWLFKDDKWSNWELNSQPPPRLQHTLSYDPLRNVMVLFGGFSRNNGDKTVLGDTWEWHTLKGWEMKANNEELMRDHHAMTYDQKNGRTILFGGYHQGYLGDTWSWNGSKWKKMSVNENLARAGKPGLVYDSRNEVVTLFGGWDRRNEPLMDFWQFNFDQQLWDQY